MMLIILSGLFAGSIHVLTGIDHIAAIAPFVAKRPHGAWIVGLLWGTGHASGVGIAFAIVLLLRNIFNVQTLSSWSEFVVGFMLIGIGCWGIHETLKKKIHSHVHEHDGLIHEHIHYHADPINHTHDRTHVHEHAAFAVGIIHGMAGSSHFLGLLPALAFPSHTAAMTYITAFGVGNICAMSGFAVSVGLLTARFALGRESCCRRLLLGCCSLTIGVGMFWLL